MRRPILIKKDGTMNIKTTTPSSPERKAKHRKAMALMMGKRLMRQDDKENVILSWTNGRTTSLRQMSNDELDDLIDWLARPTTRHSRTEKMRRKLIHYAHLMGWQTVGGDADMTRLNNWCTKYGRYHKPLNDHTLAELPHLISQFEKTFQSYLNAV